MAHPTLKPRYIDPTAGTRSLGIEPPFVFRNVTTHVFPLRASISKLAGFCDQYLNIFPPHIAEFRPSLPYVYLMVLNYGSMAMTSVQAQNVGWVAQREVTFTVPLEWWRKEGGKLVFQDWACVSPFIYVSDQMSLVTGREVYGWPKVHARVDPDLPAWSADARADTRVFSLSTDMFAKMYAGQREQSHTLLQIDCKRPPALSRFPLDPASPWLPLNAWPAAARSALGLMGEAFDILGATRIRGYRSGRDPDTLFRMLRKAGGNAARLFPDALAPLARRRPHRSGEQAAGELSIQQITLKQFRDCEDPSQACYEALVASRMGIDRLNNAGLLGDAHLLCGDPAGGYRVRIHRYAEQPVIETLGLEVAAEEQGSGGARVALLEPIIPFWLDQDLYYGKGQVVCWRTGDDGPPGSGGWVCDHAQPAAPPPAAAPAATPHVAEASQNLYNTALGAATQPVAGPFDFPDLTLQVYPLLADNARIRTFLDQYLNEPLQSTGMRFEAFGSYAYLIVSVCNDQTGTMYSSANNIGWWAEREVNFCVPVKWYRGDELVSLALVSPFVYASNGRAVITDREVNGRPTVLGTIDSPPDAWLHRSGPVAPRRMLHLETEVFPALHLGQRSEQRTLLEIDGDDVLPYNDDIGWRLVAENWGADLVVELKRKSHEQAVHAQALLDAKALALEILAHGAPINWVVLKQYRDAADMQRACYQAAVHTTRSISRIYDIQEIDERMHVRLYTQPGHPIAELLGLKIKTIDSRGGEIVQNLQPMRPFWMRVGVHEDLGRIIAWRTQDGPWNVVHPWFKGSASAETGTRPFFCGDAATRVGRALVQEGLWQRLRERSTEWLRAALRDELAALFQALKKPPTAAIDSSSIDFGEPTTPHRAALQALESAGGLSALSETTDLANLVSLADALRARLPPMADRDVVSSGAGTGQAEDGSPYRRLTRAQARHAIETLDDLQSVIDSILSDAWENWGTGPIGKPASCIPVGSVWGGSWILTKSHMDPWATRHGLKRWPDGNGAWWYVDPPAGQPKETGP